MLLAQQLRGGGWYGTDEVHPEAPRAQRGHPVDTAFAILVGTLGFRMTRARQMARQYGVLLGPHTRA